MAKNYYRSEYSGKQWKALIDKATELGCQITYSKYGNNRQHRPGEPNYSNYRERRTRQSCMGRENTRHDTGEHKAWKVQPKRYHKGYCPTICKSRRVAEFEQERLERMALNGQ